MSNPPPFAILTVDPDVEDSLDSLGRGTCDEIAERTEADRLDKVIEALAELHGAFWEDERFRDMSGFFVLLKRVQ